MAAEEAPLSKEAIQRRIARREISLWATAFVWPVLRVLALGAALGAVVAALVPELLEPLADDGADVLRLGIAYGLVIAIAPAAWAGLSSLALRLARGWAVVPALTLPIYVAVACWFRRETLHADFTALEGAVAHRLDVEGLDAMREIATSSAPSTADVPEMVASAGQAILDDAVRRAMETLESDVGTTLLVSLVPGIIVSVLALAIGYRRGWAVRHEADLARLAKA